MDMSLDSGSWCWTGRPGMLLFMGWQRVGHDWVTELNWTESLHQVVKVLELQLQHQLRRVIRTMGFVIKCARLWILDLPLTSCETEDQLLFLWSWFPHLLKEDRNIYSLFCVTVETNWHNLKKKMPGTGSRYSVNISFSLFLGCVVGVNSRCSPWLFWQGAHQGKNPQYDISWMGQRVMFFMLKLNRFLKSNITRTNSDLFIYLLFIYFVNDLFF